MQATYVRKRNERGAGTQPRLCPPCGCSALDLYPQPPFKILQGNRNNFIPFYQANVKLFLELMIHLNLEFFCVAKVEI